MSNEWVDTVLKAGIVKTMNTDVKDMSDEQLVIKALVIELAKKRWKFFWKMELDALRNQIIIARMTAANKELSDELEKTIKNTETLMNLMKDTKPND